MKMDAVVNIVKRVMGFTFLVFFIGMLINKFNDAVGDSDNPEVITFLSVIVLIFVLWGVYRVIREE